MDYPKTKKEIKIRRHSIGEKLSDNTLAKFVFAPNNFAQKQNFFMAYFLKNALEELYPNITKFQILKNGTF